MLVLILQGRHLATPPPTQINILLLDTPASSDCLQVLDCPKLSHASGFCPCHSPCLEHFPAPEHMPLT